MVWALRTVQAHLCQSDGRYGQPRAWHMVFHHLSAALVLQDTTTFGQCVCPYTFKNAEEKRLKPNMDVSDDNMWWAGGHFDGDGCITMHYGGICLGIGKAEKGMPALLKMQALFGGSITKQRKTLPAEWQPTWQWRLGGQEARGVCQRMIPYVHAKRPQFELAATMPPETQCVQVVLSHKEEGTRRFASVCEAERELFMTGWRIRGWAKRKEDRGGWTCKLLVPDREAKRERIKEIDQQLKEMKQMEHQAVDQFLPDAYFAGFIDADGCLTIKDGRPCLGVAQKWRQVLDAYATAFGGKVFTLMSEGRGRVFSYALHGQANVINAIQRLLPHLVEKKGQAEILLALTPSNAVASKTALSLLHGNGGKRKSGMMG